MNELVIAKEQAERTMQIVICDNRTLWRESLRLAIERLDPSIRIRETESVAGVLKLAASGANVGLIVLNIDLRRQDSTQELDQLQDELDGVPIVIVADSVDPGHIVSVLNRGVRGYIPTTLDSRVMVEALRLVAAGGAYIPEVVIELLSSDGPGRHGLRPDPDRLGQAHNTCTPRQRQVLDLLCLGKPNKLIAHQLEISENTVKAHLRQIMKRLNATNRTEAVLIASGLSEMQIH